MKVGPNLKMEYDLFESQHGEETTYFSLHKASNFSETKVTDCNTCMNTVNKSTYTSFRMLTSFLPK